MTCNAGGVVAVVDVRRNLFMGFEFFSS